MANVSFRHSSPTPPERVRASLVDERFLTAFVQRQHPTQFTVDVRMDERTSTMHWSNEFGSDVPALVKQFVGHQVDIELRIDVNEPGRLDLDATAKRDGHLRADLRIDKEGAGSLITITGAVSVSGLMGGLAAGQASESVIKPILEEDLFTLLDEWDAEELH